MSSPLDSSLKNSLAENVNTSHKNNSTHRGLSSRSRRLAESQQALALSKGGESMTRSKAHCTPLDIVKNLKKKDDYLTAQFALSTDHFSHKKPLILMSPGSCVKLYSIAAGLVLLGPNRKIITPLVTNGEVHDGVVEGDLILVGSGDLTFGGRRYDHDKIAFTKIDHLDANFSNNATITPQDPLKGIKHLAEQLYKNGIRQVKGDIVVDVSLFSAFMIDEIYVSPIFINENVIDILITATTIGQLARIDWRPKVSKYQIINEVKTVEQKGSIQINFSHPDERTTVISGTVPIGTKDLLKISPIPNPPDFAKRALIDALHQFGIQGTLSQRVLSETGAQPPQGDLPLKKSNGVVTNTKRNQRMTLATFVSEEFSQDAKLILKVSHNVGAQLIVILMALHNGDIGTTSAGLKVINEFLKNIVKINPREFHLISGSGGFGNLVTTHSTLKLLEFMKSLPHKIFDPYFEALPILGVDGTLASVGTDLPSKGQVFAKTGTLLLTGSDPNLPTIVKTLSGYVMTKHHHLEPFAVFMNFATTKINVTNLDSIDMAISKFSKDIALVPNAIFLKGK